MNMNYMHACSCENTHTQIKMEFGMCINMLRFMQYLGHVGTFLRLNVEFLSEIGTSSDKILIA
jgi:hypothetical protein